MYVKVVAPSICVLFHAFVLLKEFLSFFCILCMYVAMYVYASFPVASLHHYMHFVSIHTPPPSIYPTVLIPLSLHATGKRNERKGQGSD